VSLRLVAQKKTIVNKLENTENLSQFISDQIVCENFKKEVQNLDSYGSETNITSEESNDSKTVLLKSSIKSTLKNKRRLSSVSFYFLPNDQNINKNEFPKLNCSPKKLLVCPNKISEELIKISCPKTETIEHLKEATDQSKELLTDKDLKISKSLKEQPSIFMPKEEEQHARHYRIENDNCSESNIDLKEINTKLNQQLKKVIGVHLTENKETENLVVHAKDIVIESLCSKLWRFLKSFTMETQNNLSWRDYTAVLWTQRPATATIDRKPALEFPQSVWPDNLGLGITDGRPKTASFLDTKIENVDSTPALLDQVHSSDVTIIQRAHTAPESKTRQWSPVKPQLRRSRSEINHVEESLDTYVSSVPQFTGYSSFESLESGSETAHHSWKSGSGSPPCDPAVLARINGTGFRLIAEAPAEDPAEDPAPAFTEEEWNEWYNKAEEFEAELARRLDKRPCSKDELLKICANLAAESSPRKKLRRREIDLERSSQNKNRNSTGSHTGPKTRFRDAIEPLNSSGEETLSHSNDVGPWVFD